MSYQISIHKSISKPYAFSHSTSLPYPICPSNTFTYTQPYFFPFLQTNFISYLITEPTSYRYTYCIALHPSHQLTHPSSHCRSHLFTI